MSGDRDLFELFAAKRVGDLGRTPPFQRVREGRGAPGRMRAVSPTRLALGAALGLAALVVLLGVLHRDADDGADAIQLALQISGWRSPTDFLLRSMGSEYLTTIPRIGEVTQWYPLDGGVRRAMAAPDRKGSDSL